MVECVANSLRHLQNVSMGKDVDAFSLVADLFEVLRHLKEVSAKHVKKRYKDKHLSTICFDKRLYFDAEFFRDYCKVQLVLGIRYFETLIKELKVKISCETNCSLFDIIKLYEPQLHDYIFDLKNAVEPLEKTKDPAYQFFNGGKSSATRSADLYRFSKALAYGGTYVDNLLCGYHKESQVAATFVLRQALGKV